MSERDYVIAYALRTGVEERTIRLSHDEFLWFQRLFRDSMRLTNGGVWGDIRPAGTPRSPNLQAPSEPVTRSPKRTWSRSKPIVRRLRVPGGAA